MVELNHTIVWCKDQKRSSAFLAEILDDRAEQLVDELLRLGEPSSADSPRTTWNQAGTTNGWLKRSSERTTACQPAPRAIAAPVSMQRSTGAERNRPGRNCSPNKAPRSSAMRTPSEVNPTR